MTMLLRNFHPETDSEAVARFFFRLGYGSAGRAGVPLDATALQRSLAESGLRHACVAEDDERIVGTVMLVERADGFAAAPGELFGDHYLVDPLHRNRLVAGHLLAEMFQYLIATNVGTVRLRVDPANEVARRLYAQSGFRVVGPSVSNGDGFIEMVNHLPGVLHLLGDLLREDEGIGDARDVPPEFLKHFMRRIRQSGDRGGVNMLADGTRTITFDFDLHHRSFHLVLNAESGELITLSIDNRPREDLIARARPVSALVPVEPTASPTDRSAGRFSARIDEHGSLVVEHPDHVGPVLVAPFPDGHGRQIAPFRPPVLPLATQTIPEGWTQTCEQDGVRVTRRIALTASGLAIASTSQGGGPRGLVAQPLCLLRTAELAISDERGEREGHLRRGAWPLHFSGFEAAVDPEEAVDADGARHTFTDRAHGLEVSLLWKGHGLLRPYGACLADGKIDVRIELDEIPASPPRSAPSAPVKPAPLNWVDAGTSSRTHTGEAGSRIVMRDEGVTQWQAAGRMVAISTMSGGRRSRAAEQPCIWPSLSEVPRYDLQHGEGLTSRSEIPFLPVAGSETDPSLGSWTLEASEDLRRLVTQTRAPAGAGEAVMNVRLPAGPQGIGIADSDGELVVHQHGGLEWSTWTSLARVPVGDGRFLRIEALEATRPEILVRARPRSWVLSLYSERSATATSLSRWSLALQEGATESAGAEARGHLDEQTGGVA